MDQATLRKAVAYLRAHPSTFLATVAGQEPWVRAMWVARVDDDGTLWYGCAVTSNKVAQIRANPHACVAGGEGMTGVRLFGIAEVLTDAATKAAVWQDGFQDYFAGPDDPALAIIKITPTRVEVWNVSSPT